MAARFPSKLKLLEEKVPEGLIVTAAWLEQNGYSSSLRSQYLKAGWLEQPTRGVFRRVRGTLRWEQVVISLQTLLAFPVTVGGRTALELQGYAHFLLQEQREVHLYGQETLPNWVGKLPMPTRLVFHKRTRVFRADLAKSDFTNLPQAVNTDARVNADLIEDGFTRMPWGQWDWPLTLSTPERALLELLDELPTRESFHVVDKLVEGLVSLSPKRLQKLLENCGNVKVKRLFFFFADRHNPAWLKRIEREKVNLGAGDRMLVRGGKFDPVYRITVPADLDAV